MDVAAAAGTPYPEVVRKVRALTAGGPAGLGDVCLVVDASGVGEPVLGMLREEELPATLVGVTISGGQIATSQAGDGV